MIKRKLLVVAAGVVMSAGIFAACGEEATMEKVENSEITTETTEATEAPEVKETSALKVGDGVDIDGLQITLNSVKKVMGTNEYDQPTNDFYLVLDVKADNVGSDVKNLSSLMNFNLMDADGYSQDITLMPEVKGSLDGEIGSGRKMAGQIAFDVSESEYFEFIFEEPFSSGQAIWKIEKGDITQ